MYCDEKRCSAVITFPRNLGQRFRGIRQALETKLVYKFSMQLSLIIRKIQLVMCF